MEEKLLNFGEAIELVKKGNLVARKGWNGKGMFIFMRPEDIIPEKVIRDIKSLPVNVKQWLANDFFSKGGENKGPDHNHGSVKFTAYLCMKAADNTIVNGWLASQTDMLAEDWQELIV